MLIEITSCSKCVFNAYFAYFNGNCQYQFIVEQIRKPDQYSQSLQVTEHVNNNTIHPNCPLLQRTTEFVCHKTIDNDKSLCAGAITVCKKNGFNMPAEDFAIRLGLIDENHYADVEGQENFDVIFENLKGK